MDEWNDGWSVGSMNKCIDRLFTYMVTRTDRQTDRRLDT